MYSILLTVSVCMYAWDALLRSSQKFTAAVFASHTAVATADHKGAVLIINIREYLETVLLNKQEVIHEYVCI